MERSQSVRRNSTIATKVMCAVVFLTFTVCYLYFYQADTLALLQHQLSQGQTHYGRTVGTVLITITLLLLQIGIAALTKLKASHEALTYLPSMLALALLTSCASIGKITAVGIAVLIIWIAAVCLTKKMEPFMESSRAYSPFRPIARNMLTMVVMATLVGLAGNSDDLRHTQLAIERHIGEKNYEEALAVAENSEHANEGMTMARALALAHQGKMGERLFEFPIVGKGAALLPTADGAKFLLYPADSLWQWIGAKPQATMTTERFLQLVKKQGKDTPTLRQYRLCSMLIDRRIDDFAREIAADTASANHLNSLPKHYREALTLYCHLRGNPVLTYKESAMKTDFEDFLELGRRYSDKKARRTAVYEQYEGTYWWYYFYQ